MENFLVLFNIMYTSMYVRFSKDIDLITVTVWDIFSLYAQYCALGCMPTVYLKPTRTDWARARERESERARKSERKRQRKKGESQPSQFSDMKM